MVYTNRYTIKVLKIRKIGGKNEKYKKSNIIFRGNLTGCI